MELLRKLATLAARGARPPARHHRAVLARLLADGASGTDLAGAPWDPARGPAPSTSARRTGRAVVALRDEDALRNGISEMHVEIQGVANSLNERNSATVAAPNALPTDAATPKREHGLEC